MKGRLIAVLALLALCMAPSVGAYTINWDVALLGDYTIYSYFFTSDEYDTITSFHIYAPVSPGLISNGSTPNGWTFQVVPDSDIDGSDIFWSANDPDLDGLLFGQTLQVSFTTSSTVQTIYNYDLGDGYMGNWGYETTFLPGLIWVMYPSVPVPMGITDTHLPEPASILALGSGCVTLLLRRFRKKQ